jgi:MoxR-like ATPase
MSVHHESYRRFAADLLAAVGQTMYDVDEVVQLCTVALYTRGHVLLEGNPGMGKTELVKALGEVLQLPFGRIQFTPDLMPADITGTRMPDFDGDNHGRWTFQPGPVFTSLLLADEINRATPKTQSALLEAMAERQVTVLGSQYRLDREQDGRRELPFMVLATQNPIDHEGTYDLPEAQTDRFMFKILMKPPTGNTLHRIIEKQSQNRENKVGASPPARLPVDRAASLRLYHELHQAVKTINPMPSLATHIVNMVLASNGQFSELNGLSGSQISELRKLVPYFRFGLGPRAAFMLMLGAKAWSLFWGQNSNTADGLDLAHILAPTLRHRLQMKFDWQRDFAREQKIDPDADLPFYQARFLRRFAEVAAPENNRYRDGFARVLAAVEEST